jgi:MoaA/NifB/PqqE/SkfB family radical SAM enzyme
MTGIHLVLPAAQKDLLARLTRGRGSLAAAAAILDGARELGLEVTLEVPVVAATVSTLADTVQRVLNRTGHLREVLLRFTSEIDDRGRNSPWDMSRVEVPLMTLMEMARAHDFQVRFGTPDLPPPCILALPGIPEATWGDLAGRSSDPPLTDQAHPYEECVSCGVRNTCTFTGRHHRFDHPGQRPIPLPEVVPDEPTPAGEAWHGAVLLRNRRETLAPLRKALIDRHLPCISPWTHFETHSVHGVAVSCATHRFSREFLQRCGSWHDEPLVTAWNSRGMQDLRGGMTALDGQRHCSPDCPAFHGDAGEDGWLRNDPLSEPFHRNLVTNLQEILDGARILESLPQHLVISPTLRCNVACIMCRFPGEVRNAEDRSRIDMTDRQFDEVLEMLPFVRVLNVTGGEPLVAPRTRELLAAFQADRYPDGGVVLSTNGLLLDESLIRDLRKTRLIDVIVSLNAATPQTYRHLVGVDGFEKVVRNVAHLIDEGGSFIARPRVTLSMVLMRSTWRELPAFLDLAVHLGTRAQLLPMVGELGDESPMTDQPLMTEIRDFLITDLLPRRARWTPEIVQDLQTLASTIDRRVREGDFKPL